MTDKSKANKTAFWIEYLFSVNFYVYFKTTLNEICI